MHSFGKTGQIGKMNITVIIVSLYILHMSSCAVAVEERNMVPLMFSSNNSMYWY